MRLTNEKIEALKVQDEEQKIHIGRGLYLIVHPDGGKQWQVEYTSPSKHRKGTTLGFFPQVSSEEAWSKAMEVKRLLSIGANPCYLGSTIYLSKGKPRSNKITALINRVSALEDEIEKIKDRMASSDIDGIGSFVMAEDDWLQEQIDKLNKRLAYFAPEKKLPKKKEKVPKKRKKKAKAAK